MFVRCVWSSGATVLDHTIKYHTMLQDPSVYVICVVFGAPTTCCQVSAQRYDIQLALPNLLPGDGCALSLSCLCLVSLICR